MFSHIDGDYYFLVHKEFEGNTVTDVYGNRVQGTEPALETMQAKGRVEGIDLEEFERLPVLIYKVTVMIEESGCFTIITVRVENPEIHSAALETRLIWASTDSSTYSLTAISRLDSFKAASSSQTRSRL